MFCKTSLMFMKKFLFNLIAFFAIVLFFSCKTEKGATPAYIHIKKFTFTSIAATQGLATFEIRSAKLFVNSQEIGNFELPASVPVLAEGLCKIEIFPNIRETGSSNYNLYYLPYTYYNADLTLKKLRIDTVSPSCTYRSNAKFEWIEDFENQTITLNPSGQNNSSDSFKIIPMNTPGVDAPFSGSNYCAYLNMTKDSSAIFEVSSLKTFYLPNMGRDIYLEMDIKTNDFFQTGILTDNGFQIIKTPIFLIYPTNGNWKKLYINLKSETGNMPTGTSIKLLFGLVKSKTQLENPQIYIDNLKLVYLN